MKTTILSVLAVAVIASALLAANRLMRDSAAPVAAQANAGINPAGSPSEKQRKVAYWWDPMLGPSSISDHPGKSAMGMDMVPVFEDEVSKGAGVKIDPAVVQNMGVLTAPVVRQPLNVTIRAVGTLEVPEPGLHDVALKLNGYIQKLYADTDGMIITKGQTLFDLYSPDLQVAEQEIISSQQALKSLGPSANSAARRDAQSLLDSARQKLRLWDVADQDIDAIAQASSPPATVPFRAPADGHMVEKTIVQGSSVQAGMKLMRIEDHSHLWLNAQVFEEQIPLVKIGQKVQIDIEAVPGKTFNGAVAFINPHLDHMARSETVRCSLENVGHELSPGMYATARIVTQPIPDALVVPREAVIDTGTRQLAFVADPAAPGHFEPRDVKLGITGDGGVVQILSGVAPGDQVVTSGQFLMDVESRTTEAIQKLRGTSPVTQPSGGQP